MRKLKALIKRELRETYLRRKTGVVLQFFLIVFLIPVILYSFFKFSEDRGIISSIVALVYPAFIIMTIGLPFLIEHFYRDKMKGNIRVLLAVGFSPLEIWGGKILALSLFILGFYWTGIFILCIFYLFIGKNIFINSLSWVEVLNFLLLSPILGVSLLGLKGVLHFLFSDIRLLNLFFLLPFILFFVFFKYLLPFLQIIPYNEISLLIFPLIVISVIFIINWTILNYLPEEKWL